MIRPERVLGLGAAWKTEAALPERVARVRVHQVGKLFGSTVVLRGVSAEFLPGEITWLTGPNGSGKSTLLGILATRLRPTRGRVEYLSPSGRALSLEEVRAQLGLVSHETLAYSGLTARQNVELVADFLGLEGNSVERVMHRTGLLGFADRPVAVLSRGQKQRVALARALVGSPDLLLLDEPWTGLDQKSAAELEQIVLEEKRAGRIVIVVSHEPDLGARLGARELSIGSLKK